MDFVLENMILDENNRPIISDNGLILCEIRDQDGNTGLRYIPLNLIQQLQNEPLNQEELSEDCSPQLSTSTSPAEATADPRPSTSTAELPTKITWPENVTKLFLNLYIEYYPQIGPFKLFKNKKCMWTAIARKLKEQLSFDCSHEQCESHLKSIMRSYNTSMKKNRTTGNVRKEIQWQEEIDKIRAMDDSVCPDILVGVGKVVNPKKDIDNDLKRKKKGNDRNDNCSKKIKREKETKENKYIEAIMKIAKLKEKGQNKRLKKTLQVLREIQFGKLANNNKDDTSEDSDDSDSL